MTYSRLPLKNNPDGKLNPSTEIPGGIWPFGALQYWLPSAAGFGLGFASYLHRRVANQ